MSFAGSRPTLKRHQAQQPGWAPLQADAFAFQIDDAADVVPGEQLETADMHAGDHGLPAQLLERRDVEQRKVEPEIDL